MIYIKHDREAVPRLELCLAHGWRVVECFSDSLEAVSLVSSGPSERHTLAPLIWDIKGLLERRWYVVLRHTLREGNACADFLAKMEARHEDPLHTVNSPPYGMSSLLLADSMDVYLICETIGRV